MLWRDKRETVLLPVLQDNLSQPMTNTWKESTADLITDSLFKSAPLIHEPLTTSLSTPSHARCSTVLTVVIPENPIFFLCMFAAI